MGLIKKWAKRQAAKGRCGVFPFQLPAWWPFTECCDTHDHGYAIRREIAIENYIENPKDFDINDYENSIQAVDDSFLTCMDHKIDNTKWMVRRAMYRGIKVTFITLVNQFGWRIWREGTEDELNKRGYF